MFVRRATEICPGAAMDRDLQLANDFSIHAEIVASHTYTSSPNDRERHNVRKILQNVFDAALIQNVQNVQGNIHPTYRKTYIIQYIQFHNAE